MTYQTTVGLGIGLGVIGELYVQSPVRAQSYILNSVSAAYNVFGRGFTKQAEGIAQAGGSGAFGFAGILSNPKGSALYGLAGAPLSPNLVLPNNAQGELVTMGSVIVTLAAAAAIGDLVVMDNTTGVLATIAPGAALPTGTTFCKAFVDFFTVTVAGLAVITLNPVMTIPVP